MKEAPMPLHRKLYSILHRTLAAFSCACLLVGLTAPLYADIDKDDLEKITPKKGTLEGQEGGGGHQEVHERLEKEAKENLDEIARLMEKIRDDLSQKKTGPATQSRQKDVLKKLDELIAKIGKGCGNPG